MRRRLSWRLALLSCAVVGLAACADGYPSEDGPLVLTYGMDREAILKAMNTIGQHGYLEHRWRYEVDAGCQLRVRSGALKDDGTTLPAATAGLATRVVATGGERSHMVFVHLPGSSTPAGSLVLGGANEFDAGQMKWLVDYLGTVCRTR